MDIDLSRAIWHKSTFSNGSGGNCIEVSCNLPNVVAVRDSKNPEGPKLVLSPADWRSFTASVKTSSRDLSYLGISLIRGR